MTLSFTARMQRGANRASLLAHVLRRAVVLIFLGLLVNGFPDYPLHTIRIPGGLLAQWSLKWMFLLSGVATIAVAAASSRLSTLRELT
jgi:hypothetical protein